MAHVALTNMIDLLRELGEGSEWSPVRNELTIGDEVVQIVAPGGDLVYHQAKDPATIVTLTAAIQRVQIKSAIGTLH